MCKLIILICVVVKISTSQSLRVRLDSNLLARWLELCRLLPEGFVTHHLMFCFFHLPEYNLLIKKVKKENIWNWGKRYGQIHRKNCTTRHLVRIVCETLKNGFSSSTMFQNGNHTVNYVFVFHVTIIIMDNKFSNHILVNLIAYYICQSKPCLLHCRFW